MEKREQWEHLDEVTQFMRAFHQRWRQKDVWWKTQWRVQKRDMLYDFLWCMPYIVAGWIAVTGLLWLWQQLGD